MNKSQINLIMEYMKAGNKITPLEALSKFGCLRLASIIYKIKEKGFNVDTEIIRNGKNHYAQYSMPFYRHQTPLEAVLNAFKGMRMAWGSK